MKAYLKAQRKIKENDLKNARSLLSKLNKLSNNSRDTDNIVKRIKSYIAAAIDGDGTQGFIMKAGEINKNATVNINSAITSTNSLIQKIQNQITNINNQIEDIEEEEARRRAEEASKKNNNK